MKGDEGITRGLRLTNCLALPFNTQDKISAEMCHLQNYYKPSSGPMLLFGMFVDALADIRKLY